MDLTQNCNTSETKSLDSNSSQSNKSKTQYELNDNEIARFLKNRTRLLLNGYNDAKVLQLDDGCCRCLVCDRNLKCIDELKLIRHLRAYSHTKNSMIKYTYLKCKIRDNQTISEEQKHLYELIAFNLGNLFHLYKVILNIYII